MNEQPKAMTQVELEAEAKAAEEAALELDKPVHPEVEAKAAEEAARAEADATKLAEEQAKADAEAKAAEEAAKVTTTDESIALKAVIAEKEARIAELTKRVRDEDGRRGGELSSLRAQISDLMGKVEELKAHKPSEPVVPPEPDELETQYPELARNLDKRLKPTMDAVKQAEAAAKEAKEELARLKQINAEREQSGFLSTVDAAVPNRGDYEADPEFQQWCHEESLPGYKTRQTIFDECIINRNAKTAINLFQQWESFKKSKADSQSQPPPVSGPKKPSQEAQVALPSSTAKPAEKKQVVDKARIATLKKMIFSGRATKEEGLEYNRLLDLEALEELSQK
jgi:hypothetical protein